MFQKKLCIVIYGLLFLGTQADEKFETSCNINGKRALNYVSDKFLSISIDPAVLLAGVNLSETSLRLAKHLSPAYIRLAGPSTEFVKYADEDISLTHIDTTTITLTPSTWFGINEWLALTNLTPIFGINDADTTNEKDIWNPKNLLPLLEISDKLNISCYWQLGFDSSKKTDIRYMQDLDILHNILEAFTGRNESWKIVGSDLSHISDSSLESTIHELREYVTAFMWEPSLASEESFLKDGTLSRVITKSGVNIWTTAPKSLGPITFNSALTWAKEVGQSAQQGYNVIFRQPRMYELFTVTPVYWFSLLHKQLMGNNVLESKTSNNAGIFICAHCTRNQNSYVRRGALTIMIINENEEPITVKVKLGNGVPDKTMEVQEYVLTSTDLNSTATFLNGDLLTFNIFKEKHPFKPKIRRAKTPSYIPLFLPRKSIGFFVLPDARTSICIDKEIETQLLLEEIEEDQNALLPDDLGLTLDSRSIFGRNQALEAITQHLKSEILSDQKYYHNPVFKTRTDTVKENKENVKEEKAMERGRKFFIDRAKLSQKQRKQMDLERRREELQTFLTNRNKSRKTDGERKLESDTNHMEFSSKEIENILKERAKARAAARNVVFTDEELEAIVQKASTKFIKKIKRSLPVERNRRDINMAILERSLLLNSLEKSENKFDDVHQKHKTNVRLIRRPRDVNSKMLGYKGKLKQLRTRMADRKDELIGNAKENLKDKMDAFRQKSNRRFIRDINMDLLKTKTEGSKKKVIEYEKKPFFKNQEQKVATLRKPGQTSEELFEELRNQMGSVEEVEVPVKTDVYAELAISDEDEDESLPITPSPKKSRIFDKKPKFDPFVITNPNVEEIAPTLKKRKNKNRKTKPKSEEDLLQFLTSSEEFTDIEEGLPCIHEYFGEEFRLNNNQHDRYLRQELGETSSDTKKNKKKNSSSNKIVVSSSEFDETEQFRKKREIDQNEKVTKNNTIYATLGDLGYPRDILLNDEELLSEKFNHSVSDELSVRPLNKQEIFDALLQEGKLPSNTTYEYELQKLENNPPKNEQLRRDSDSEHDISPSNVSENGTNTTEDVNNDQASVDNKRDKTILQIPELDVIRQVNKHILEAIENATEKSSEIANGTEDLNSPHHNNSEIKLQSTVKENNILTEEDRILENKTTLNNTTVGDQNDTELTHDSFDKEIPDHIANKTTDQKFRDVEITLARLNNSQNTNENTKEKDEVGEDRFRLADLYNWAHSAQNSEDPRHKRERKPTTESVHDTSIANVLGDVTTQQKDLKEQFKELKQMISKDKLKFEEEKQKNRQKLLQLKKQQDELLKQETEDILTKIHNDELARRQELIKQINSMKKKLLQKKNEIDTMLIKDLQLKDRNDNILEKTAENTLQKFTDDVGKLLQGDSNNALKKTKTSSRSRRSLFDTARFGNYKSRSLDIKPWRPADILALKREKFLGTNKQTPPNDIPIFKNLFEQTRYRGYRKRRNLESLTNEINDYLNEIDSNKFNQYSNFKGYVEKGPPKDKSNETNNVIQKIGEVEANKQNLKSSNIQNLLLTPKKVNADETKNSDLTVDQISKEESKIMGSIVKNISSFFKTVTEQLGKYMRQFTEN